MRTILLFWLCLAFASLSAQEDAVARMLRQARAMEQYGPDSLSGQLYYYLSAYRRMQPRQDERALTAALRIGEIYESRDLFATALEYYLPLTEATYYERLPWSGRRTVLERIGSAYANAGQPERGLPYLEQVLERSDYPENISVLRQIVRAFYVNRAYDRATFYNDRIKQLLKVNGEGEALLARIDNNLGYSEGLGGAGVTSLKYLKQAEAQAEASGADCDVRLPIYVNLGITYYNDGRYGVSSRYLERALECADDDATRAEINQILGTTAHNSGKLYEAVYYLDNARDQARAAGDQALLSDVLLALARVYGDRFEHDRALDYYREHFTLRDSLSFTYDLRRRELQQFQQRLRQIGTELDSLQNQGRLQELRISQLSLRDSTRQLAVANLRLDSIRREGQLLQLRQAQLIQESTIRNQQLEAVRSEQALRLANQQLLATEREREVSRIQIARERQQLVLERQEAMLGEERAQKGLLEKDAALSALELEKQNRYRNNILAALALVLSLLAMLIYFYRNKRRDHAELQSTYGKLETAQQELVAADVRIKSLLSQQVSAPIASALMQGVTVGKVEQRFVAIMFLDIRNFTVYAEVREPEEIIDYQNKVFGFMMEIVEQNHGVVNQLMGDGFMATFGAPVSTGNDCANAYRSAIEILDQLDERVAKEEFFPTRIGIGLHAGYVVTGNVGNNQRMQYSITGNPVIMTARLESLNKELNSTLVFSRFLYDQLPEELHNEKITFQDVMVKGRSEPISVAAPR